MGVLKGLLTWYGYLIGVGLALGAIGLGWGALMDALPDRLAEDTAWVLIVVVLLGFGWLLLWGVYHRTPDRERIDGDTGERYWEYMGNDGEWHRQY